MNLILHPIIILLFVGIVIGSVVEWAIYRKINRNRYRRTSWQYLLAFGMCLFIALKVSFKVQLWRLFGHQVQDSKLLFLLVLFISILILNTIIIWIFQRFDKIGLKRAIVSIALCSIIVFPILTGLPMLAFWPPLAQLSFPDTTQYASEFTEKKFSEVKSGMSMNAVQALLGTPIRRGAGWWDYTQSGGSYHVRRIYFSHEGKVIRKKAYYYID